MPPKVIPQSLTPPQPEQIRLSRAVQDWLAPQGRDMRLRSPTQVRQEVARKLAIRLRVPGITDDVIENDVLKWLGVWADERTTPLSGPRSAALVALQLEAHQVFQGGQVEHLAADAERRDVKAIQKQEGSFLRHLLVQMYVESQEQLRERGIKEITLWRGERGIFSPEQEDFLDIGEIPFQPLNSFSHQLKQAFRFAGQGRGALILVSAPASRILATPATGFGVLQQKEEVLFSIPNGLGVADQGLVAQWRDLDDWQEIFNYGEMDWVELIRDFYQVRLDRQFQEE